MGLKFIRFVEEKENVKMVALIIFLGILSFSSFIGFLIFGIIVMLISLVGIIGMGCYTKDVVSEHHIVMWDNANNVVKDSYYRGYEYITNDGCIQFIDDNVYCGYIIDKTLVKEK